jgi:hypothetical protein
VRTKRNSNIYWGFCISTQKVTATGAAAVANKAAAIADYRKIAGYPKLLQESGLSLTAIADRLNNEGHKTRQGKEFKSMTVKRSLDRLEG